jgi:hypothetical protein
VQPSLPPVVDRGDKGVADPFEQEHSRGEQTVREPHDQVRHGDGNGQACKHVAYVVRSNRTRAAAMSVAMAMKNFPMERRPRRRRFKR